MERGKKLDEKWIKERKAMEGLMYFLDNTDAGLLIQTALLFTAIIGSQIVLSLVM